MKLFIGAAMTFALWGIAGIILCIVGAVLVDTNSSIMALVGVAMMLCSVLLPFLMTKRYVENN
ncbi:hypothetical protein [Vibrio splendidus]|uniref:hypothetical protein n=1 Tax=Vibrio splendidus TaxID=29497 RepID=UPI000C835AA6|nr:hypothetical protein [Vibrio splendidus]PMH03392.1 hypothetical protein BCU75_23685 [Vibrio splendidus]